MNSLATLVDASSGRLGQRHRLIRLHTALGRDALLAERLEVDEAIGPGGDARDAGTRIVVQAVSSDMRLDLQRLIGRPALVELLTQAGRDAWRPWHGHVTLAELLGSDGGLARYRLTIEPWLASLRETQDAWVFRDLSVPGIVEAVFADHQGRGALAPAWRWDLADPSVYPRRSLCIQYQESDLQFVQRLLREEGLFHWFEHRGDAEAPTFGAHTLVIADHNGAFRSNAQPEVRYTQSHLAMREDGLTRWTRSRHLRSARIELASPDYRSMDLRPVGQGSVEPLPSPAIDGPLAQSDVAGAYAYADRAHGERLASRRMQALDAQRGQVRARGQVRTLAPATTFTLRDHPVHDGSDPRRDEFVVLGVRHRARNNLGADPAAGLDRTPGIARSGSGAPAGLAATGLANDTDEALYECEIVAQAAAVPVRLAEVDERGQPDARLHPRSNAAGVQTAIVVGAGGPIRTDRDHRVKLQFHWQRGTQAAHRLAHPSGDDNAPASEASGTWVRVGESVAGADWGANFVPRVGQEVLVAFIEGDIDRPVVVGSHYNGRGLPAGQGNARAVGTGGSTGNAPAWFPGERAQGRLQAHRHPAVHSGFKSQELSSSQSGAGGYNQLVFDDTPGAGRIELASTQAASRLQLGHLLQQVDNQRLAARGHGIDLATEAWGAVRAGRGLLLGAAGHLDAADGPQLEARTAVQRLAQAQGLVAALSPRRRAPDGDRGAAPSESTGLPAAQALADSERSLGARAGAPGDARSGRADTSGRLVEGLGAPIPAWGRPDLSVDAGAGIFQSTPASVVYSAGETLSLVSTRSLQHLTRAQFALAALDRLVLHTQGRATDAASAGDEPGIRLQAARGDLAVRSLGGAARLTAARGLGVASVEGRVLVSAPLGLLATAAGAAIELRPDGIVLRGPGRVEFRSLVKRFDGPVIAA